MPTGKHRGIVAIILAAALAIVLIIVAVSAAYGVKISELGRDAAWAMLGAVAGALVTYMSTKGSPPAT